MKKSAAFTLIELLVVIAIIAILAGIALPVFNKVLEKGHVTQDCSNLRQLGIGTVAYVNDHEDVIFTQTANSTATPPLFAPGQLAANYVPNIKAFLSPFDTNATAAARSGAAVHPVSYGINSNIYVTAPPWDGNTTKFVAASQLILYTVAYTGDPAINASWTGTDTADLMVNQGGTGQMTKGTHQNGRWIDVLYADMHVASIKFTDFQTTTDKSAAGGINGLNQWKPLGQ